MKSSPTQIREKDKPLLPVRCRPAVFRCQNLPLEEFLKIGGAELAAKNGTELLLSRLCYPGTVGEGSSRTGSLVA